MTLGENLLKLVSIAGRPLSTESSNLMVPPETGSTGLELQELLAERNGFLAFESALLVRPSSTGQALEVPLQEWNDPRTWIESYSGLASPGYFFAEDVFGSQFALVDDVVITFDAETGERAPIAQTLEEWAKVVLNDYEYLTGHPIACAWQQQRGRIPHRKRLLPKIPFVLGGAFDLENLYLADSIEGMRSRGHMAQQIVDLPDGAQVKLVVED